MILRECLEEHRGELRQAVMIRLFNLLDQAGSSIHSRPAVERTVVAATDFGLASVASSAPHAMPIPAVMLSHARSAARAQVPLDQVVRAYTCGYSALVEGVLDAVESAIPPASSCEILRPLAVQLDRSLNAVACEYTQAVPGRHAEAAPPLHTRLVQKLLVGEQVDSTVLHYDFSGWHTAVVLEPTKGITEHLRAVARQRNVRLLVAELDHGTVTAWFGSSSRRRLEDLFRKPKSTLPDATAASGEPGPGFGGWQLTYRQAASIWPYVQHSPPGIHRYADNGLVASIAFNPLLARSMRSLYIDPLSSGSDGGEPGLVETVRAYLASGRNASSAAASLGLSRQTVKSRLQAAEKRLGRSLVECGAEVEIALRLGFASGVNADPSVC